MLYVELYAKRENKLRLFGAVLDKSERARLDISSAKYEKVLQWQWGKFEYQPLLFSENHEKRYCFGVRGQTQTLLLFLFLTYIVISEERPNDFVAYILFLDLHLFHLFSHCICRQIHVHAHQKIQTINSLFTKIRIQFIWYIVASLAVVFCISILYINEQNFLRSANTK